MKLSLPALRRDLAFLAMLVLMTTPMLAAAQVSEPIPEPLKPWLGWTLKGAEEQRCAAINGVRTCVFPTSLALSAKRGGGSFSFDVRVDHDRLVTLPGSAEHFPLDVREGKTAIAVVDIDGLPSAHLTAGDHRLTGRFEFTVVPDSLTLPANLATLELSVEGVRVPFPRRDASGLLWLTQRGDAAEEERLSLSVHRRLEDGVPVRLITRLHVSAAGKAREVVLPNVLVAGTRPIELRTGLPAELSAEGTLRTQIQAGEHDLEIVAIRETEAADFAAPVAPEPWPERELWVIKTDERLRHVEVSGPTQIDPARTDLANDWRGLPTYVMPAKEMLKLVTRRRGEPEPAPNQLTLERSLWLDLDGDGYTVRDELGGKLHRHFRLDLLSAQLGHVVDHGQDQLITRYGRSTGVELREQAVNLRAEWRLEHAREELPAVGYNEDVDSLKAHLFLPPGFMLLAAEGVDQLPGTWLDSWDLFDFFFVLLVSLAVAKVSGKMFGVLALVALILTHHEPDAPSAAWVFLLTMTALHVALKGERFAKWVRAGWLFAAACVVLVMLPFSVMQVRKALYPHLDPEATSVWDMTRATGVFTEQAPVPASAPAPAPVTVMEGALQDDKSADVAQQDAFDGELEESASTLKSSSHEARGGSGTDRPRRAKQVGSAAYKVEVDPSAVVQTGPGLPSWSFRQFLLSWSGPVQRDQRIKLWIATPLVTRAWALASVLFSALLFYALARVFRRDNREPGSTPPSSRAALTTTIAGLLLAAVALAPCWSRANAQSVIPSPELLNELRARLLEPAKCEPHCLSVSSLVLRVEPTRLSVEAEVHVQALSTYQAPGPLESWAPDSVRVDGKDAPAAARSEDGFLHVRVEAGVHQLALSGPIPRSQAFTLALGSTPHHVRAEHKGFIIEGLRDDGRAEGSLSIRREVTQNQAEEAGSQGLVQWFEVRREIELGIRFRIQTTVTRLGPATDSALVRVPLLPGEGVSEAGLVSDKGSVVIELPRGESEKVFASGLSPVPSLQLRAAAAAPGNGPVAHPFSEVWVIAPSVLYRPSFEGIAPVFHMTNAGNYQPEFRPFPGESLTVHAARLTGAEGASVTTDSAHVRFTPGTRLEQARLTFAVRTSRGTTEHFQLPRDALLNGVTVDGVVRPTRLKDGKLEVHLDPGAHQLEVALQRPAGMGFRYQPLALASGRWLTNVTSEVQLPDGRWLLFARGPAWGPAVLFWGYLVVVLLFATALGQLALSPLKTHQWILLGLGLTQVEAPVALTIVGWLFALAYRKRHWPDHPTLFNAVQALLVLMTMIALACLGYAVHRGLVVQPSMQVEGMGSTDQLLRWYADRTGGTFPDLTIWSAPLWTYKALMLLWALWLAASLIRWLRWGFVALRAGGGLRTRPRAAHAARGNPQVALGDIEAAEAELKRRHAPPSEGGSGPEGAGIP